MEDERTRRILNGELLDVIRVRTAMYTGSRTLTAVSYFLDGYNFCLGEHGIDEKPALPFDFHDWVAYRLHFVGSSRGYRQMILDHVPDDHLALDRFFELLDEYRSRTPNIVAILNGTEDIRYTDMSIRSGTSASSICQIPGPQTMVTYTDDPGYFIRGNDPTLPLPRNGYFNRTLSRTCKENVRILDSKTYDRLLAEDEEYWKEIRRSVDAAKSERR